MPNSRRETTGLHCGNSRSVWLSWSLRLVFCQKVKSALESFIVNQDWSMTVQLSLLFMLNTAYVLHVTAMHVCIKYFYCKVNFIIAGWLFTVCCTGPGVIKLTILKLNMLQRLTMHISNVNQSLAPEAKYVNSLDTVIVESSDDGDWYLLPAGSGSGWGLGWQWDGNQVWTILIRVHLWWASIRDQRVQSGAVMGIF